ncbi:hypothetical protein Emag_006484 [Eimeria magna]
MRTSADIRDKRVWLKLPAVRAGGWQLRARRRRQLGGRQADLRAAEAAAAGLLWRETGARRRPRPGGVVAMPRMAAAAPVEPGVRKRDRRGGGGPGRCRESTGPEMARVFESG